MVKGRYLCLACKGSGVDPKKRKLKGVFSSCVRRCEECFGKGYVLRNIVQFRRDSHGKLGQS